MGAFAWIFNSSHACAPSLRSSQSHKVNNLDDCRGFLEESQLYWMCTTRNQWSLCWSWVKRHRINWWQGMTLRKLTFPARATKTLAVASEWGYSNFVCMCLQTRPKMELNQKLTKSLHRRHSIRGAYPRRKNIYICKKNLGVKCWGRFLLKGGVFSQICGMYIDLRNTTIQLARPNYFFVMLSCTRVLIRRPRL